MNLNGSSNLCDFGDFRLDTAQKVLWRDGEVVSLPLKAVELLCVLVENRGEIVSKNDLLGKVWADSFVEESVLTQNIYLLRKTLQTNGGGKNIIKNVSRRGYIFNADVSTVKGAAHTAANGADTVIERHLFEKIQVEEVQAEEDETQRRRDADAKRERLQTSFMAWRFRVLTSIFAVAIILGLTAAYFYFREDSGQKIADIVPPLKLKAVSTPSAVKTLAILPLQSADERLASKFTRNLSIRLGSVNKFIVKPFDLVREHQKSGTTVPADFIVEGEVRAKDGLFTTKVRLLDRITDSEIWTGQFEFDNLLQLEDAATHQVSKEILSRLTTAEREAISKRLPTNFEAYINYQKAQALWRRRKDGSAYFRKAIELDQSFASAYALLANIKATGGVRGSAPAKEAEALLAKAFALDENLADAYAVQGFIRIFHYHDWAGAEKSLKNAVELDTNNVNAHHWLGVYYSIHRRLDEAKAEIHLALELDPTNPTLLADIGQLHSFAGENDVAMDYVKRAVDIDPTHIFATEYLNLIRQPPELGSREAVLKDLSHLVEMNAFTLPYINIDPRYNEIRSDRHFQAILRKINLAE